MAKKDKDKDSNNDWLLVQALTELKEANKNLSNTLSKIDINLDTLNDKNILHYNETCNNHNITIERLDRYWWLIIVMFVVILIIMGYKEAVKYIIF